MERLEQQFYYIVPVVPALVFEALPRFELLYPLIIRLLCNFVGEAMLPRIKHLIQALFRVRRWIDFPAGFSTSHPCVRIYMDTASDVLMYYMCLLAINMSNIWLILFPSITIFYIAALCINQLRGDASSGKQDTPSKKAVVVEEDDDRRSKGRLAELELMQFAPQWLLCSVEVHLHLGASFEVSSFFLFLSSTLASVSRMAARLARLDGAAPSLKPASELLHRATLVVLLVAAHMLAAELIGADDAVVLLCLPELAPALLWFSLQLADGGNYSGASAVAVDNNIRQQRINIPLFGILAAAFAVAAYLATSLGERGLFMCAKPLVSSGFSGILVYCVVFVLHRWPRQAGNGTDATILMEVVRMLKIWGNTLLIAAATLMLPSSVTVSRLGLTKQWLRLMFPKLVVG